jgi:hypothetical protein
VSGTGGVGGASGRGGGGGLGGAAGVAGTSGGSGSGGSAAGGNAGTGADAGAARDAAGDVGDLPACDVSTRPADPTNRGADGGLITSSSGTCNSIVLMGPTVVRGCFDRQGDGGVLDGGVFAGPAGGPIRDGDYDVISADSSLSTGTCASSTSSGTTQRAIRVFGGGTYIEWGAVNHGTSGVDTNLYYDTTMRAAGHTLTFVSYDCGDTFQVVSYGYTATDESFTYFAYSDNADGAGYLQTVVRYRRTCWR